ncbi:MAG: tyrosine--tRNA ligase [Parcubacteria group bacterium]|jgi:tyrosyl-tRNA synthetase
MKETKLVLEESRVDGILNRGVIVEVLPTKKEFRERLLSGDKMKFYIGADPTSTSLHLSHAKNYMLLEDFRRLGHEVIVLFGDFTARIGDPTDRATARKQLTREEVLANVQDWINQIRPLMDFDAKENPPRIVYNHDWLSKLTMEDVVNLASNMTVQRMLERDMFEKRMREEKPIFLHEFMYPLMQGFDSVALEVDVELCGTDQTFNALVGRTLLKKLKGKDKFVVAVHLMENPVTGELMSKSRGTGVFLNSTPFDMYGSIMAQSDEMTQHFLICNTRIPLDEVKKILQAKNPRDAKMIAAYEVTKVFHGEDATKEAQDKFIRLVQKKEFAEDVPEVVITNPSIGLFDLLRKGLNDDYSNTKIRQLIRQKSVKINGEVVDVPDEIIHLSGAVNVRVGKKVWFKVVR